MDFNFDTSTISQVLVLDPGTNALTVGGTTGLILPSGTTAQRSASTAAIRFNTDTSTIEGYNGASWITLQSVNSNLTGLSSFSGNGFVVSTGVGSFAPRTITGTASNITVTNGDGIAGNPTINLATAGLQTPASSTLLAPRAWRTNNATAGVVAIDIIGTYIETDY